jgi:hypothetical protein
MGKLYHRKEEEKKTLIEKSTFHMSMSFIEDNNSLMVFNPEN